MTLLYLNSDKMGQGDPDLGTKLMKVFLIELVKSGTKIDYVSCTNSAVNLTTQEGRALESLKTLEENGAKISSCITCLNFHNKKDDLLIGSIGTMTETVKLLVEADKIIKPN
jgi:hypothetical protein